MNPPDSYQPPQSDLDPAFAPTLAKTPAEWILFSLGLLGGLVTALVATLLVPQFDETYQNFGVALPLITRLVTRLHVLLWLLPVLPIAVWFGWLPWPAPHRRGRTAALLAMAIPVLGFPVLIFALYLPIFGLASTI